MIQDGTTSSGAGDRLPLGNVLHCRQHKRLMDAFGRTRSARRASRVAIGPTASTSSAWRPVPLRSPASDSSLNFVPLGSEISHR